MYKYFLKRLIDVMVAALILLVFLPFFLVIAFLIKIESKGPVFFVQERVGRNLSTFKLLKLRTMTHQKRSATRIVGRASGVTKVGYWLRRFKVDELPQLVNVLKGDMSLVGPRPSVPEQLSKMSDEEKKRYSVRPGLTGLAQVSGNIHLDWKERYKLDLRYVQNVSMANDLKILFRTFILIFIGEEKFIGKPLQIKED